jgi:hypothetical protein
LQSGAKDAELAAEVAELAAELATGQGGGAADDADMHKRRIALGETLGGIAARLRQQ